MFFFLLFFSSSARAALLLLFQTPEFHSCCQDNLSCCSLLLDHFYSFQPRQPNIALPGNERNTSSARAAALPAKSSSAEHNRFLPLQTNITMPWGKHSNASAGKFSYRCAEATHYFIAEQSDIAMPPICSREDQSSHPSI